MPPAPLAPARRLAAASLASLYSWAIASSGTALLWGLQLALPGRAQAQSVPVLAPDPTLSVPGVPTTPIPGDRLVNPSSGALDNFLVPTNPGRSAPPDLLDGPNADPTIKFKRYRLGPGDAIAVSIQQFPDLSLQTTINPEGNIVMPLVNAIPLEGLTLGEAEALIRQSLDRYIIEPQVSVALLAQRPVQVTVLGAVAKPGFYPLPVPRVSVALLQAGGSMTNADLREVAIRRTLVDGSIIEQKIDLFSALKDGSALPDLRLEDGDSVFVPELEGGKDETYDRFLVARSTLAKQQISIRVLSYAGPRGGAVGNLTLPNGSTFLDALGAIGPNPDNANLRKIALVRFDPEQGKAITRTLDARKALAGDISQNVPLQENDVIVVGRNLVARITYALGTFTQPFRDVLGFLLFFDELQNSASSLFGPAGNDDND